MTTAGFASKRDILNEIRRMISLAPTRQGNTRGFGRSKTRVYL